MNKFFVKNFKKKAFFCFSCFFLIGLGSFFLTKSSQTEMSQSSMIAARFANLPIHFEENKGQFDEVVKYTARGPGYSFFFTSNETVIALKNETLRMRFMDANHNPLLEGLDKLVCTSHYFIGNDSQNWRTDIPNYNKICYQSIYPGIDVVFYGNGHQLEYDLNIAPHSDPARVRLNIEGAKELAIDDSGNLRMFLENDEEIQMLKPIVYQIENDQKIFVESRFVMLAKNEIGFALGTYDQNKRLVIDPILSYSTFLGGNAEATAYGIAVDSNGSAYVTGDTFATNFPTKNAFQASPAEIGFVSAFITKFSPDGSSLVYSTYLGGAEGSSFGRGIAVDSSENAYVVGNTDSLSFPVQNPYLSSASPGITYAFVTKLASTGNALVYSTYLGASEGNTRAADVTVDASKSACVTGETFATNFPTLNAFQAILAGSSDAYVTKFSPAGNTLVYSTYLGGTGGDTLGSGITVNNAGNVIVVGSTSSPNFPTQNAFQASIASSNDGFITSFSSAGNTLVYSTYLGGSGGQAEVKGVAVDGLDYVYVTGSTNSPNFPTLNAFQATLAGFVDVFVTKFSPAGNALVYSTYLGGSGGVNGAGDIAVNAKGNVFVTGITDSPNFPLVNPIQSTLLGSRVAFITKFITSGQGLEYSTYLGGSAETTARSIALDPQGSAYVTGETNSADFPVTPNAFQTTYPGNLSAFVSKLITVFPPTNAKGTQAAVHFVSQTEFINIITWKAPTEGPPPSKYIIYRDAALTQQIAVIPANGKLKYKQHNVRRSKEYTYYIVSVDAFGNQSSPTVVTILGKKSSSSSSI